VRLGIATGLAVVGDLIGEGAAQERGVVGETPNLGGRRGFQGTHVARGPRRKPRPTPMHHSIWPGQHR
jgi:hypothetical protein